MGIFDYLTNKAQSKMQEQQDKITEKIENMQRKLDPFGKQKIDYATDVASNLNASEQENEESLDQKSTDQIKKEMSGLENQLLWLRNEVAELTWKKEKLEKDLSGFNNAVSYQEFGLYEPRFDFCSVEEYSEKLNEIRQKQKDLIKNDQAVKGSTSWTLNNSAAQGRKMVNDMKKLLLRAFNSECDEIVAKVKYNNIRVSADRMERSKDTISKLGSIMGIEIHRKYYNLKLDELYLALEYQIAKQKEKERLRELREQQREEAKLQKEIEAERKKIEKEKRHFLNALKSINDQLQRGEGDREALLEKQQEMQVELGEIDKALADVDYRAANQKAGFVYVISNIGSFGPDVYKIGMTRRLDPTERVDELGDASVPFKFDIHAMIFSEDAPALEAALHRAFDSKKLNLVNSRREFFKVTLAEIKEEVKKNYSKTTEWFDEPDAEQFRISEKMRDAM